MARGHFGILASLQFFNIRWIRHKTSDSTGTHQGMHRVRGSKNKSLEWSHLRLGFSIAKREMTLIFPMKLLIRIICPRQALGTRGTSLGAS